MKNMKEGSMWTSCFSYSFDQEDPVPTGPLLHGTLHIAICEAEHLHRFSACVPNFIGKLISNIRRKLHLPLGLSRTYATIELPNALVGRTRMIKERTSNPEWEERFHIYCAHNASEIRVTIKHDKRIGAPILGKTILLTKDLPKEPLRGPYPLMDSKMRKRGKSNVSLEVHYIDVKEEESWGAGIKDGYSFPGVPFTYYKQKKGCKVTLYHTAHTPNDFHPKISLEGHTHYEPTRCWEDIYTAMNEAKHFIYITGWSIYTKIRLLRDPHRMCSDETLGDLLKRKASEGVRVLILLWDDRTSFTPIQKSGIMETHDEETISYFEDSDVHCVRCPRNPDNGLSLIQGVSIATMFTHHQKSVVLDALYSGKESGNRRVVSFIGGIDLCDGRYDTPYHSLFHTLGTTHKDDFHQPCIPDASITKGGPREPWQDIHSKLEGPVAWDVLCNFEQRWKKQGTGVELLLPLDDVTCIDSPTAITDEQDPETWHVQIFRSIDGGAAADFPTDPKEAAMAGLVSGKDSTIDRSIQDAYIHAIRRAKHFIYIENQYFLGSSFAWDSNHEANAIHLIPKELALKIVSKIEAGERFMAYIVIPMWPEGHPESDSVQSILYWQRKTMEMMYSAIANALASKKIDGVNPRDYLAFYCLGNRETKVKGEYVPPESPPEGSNYKCSQERRRFMIYVHSKLMIVDDEYIILGSANLNQRSMDGGRDTEIAMGGYQPHYTGRVDAPRGQIHGFRMSLWYKHLGKLEDVFLQPWSLECAKKVNKIASEHWEKFVCQEVVDLPGHLLAYPILVSENGQIKELPGHSNFPETNAPILGTNSHALPPIITT